MSFASVNGNAITRGQVQVSDWGLWWADVNLQEGVEFAKGDRVTLTVADKTMACAVVSGGVYEGTAAYRLVGGRGKWGEDVKKQGYANDLGGGVKMSTVVTAAANACGETVNGFPSTAMGPQYARLEGPAIRVLNQVAPRGWHVDFDGVTQYGLRPTTVYSGTDPLTRVVPDGSIVELSPEEIGNLLPGVTINGSAPATDVEYVLDPKRLTVRVYASRARSRRLEAIRRIVEGLFPDLRFRGHYEFRVVQQVGERFDLQPVRSASGMPDLSNVPTRPGTAGLKAVVHPGCLVLVVFADANPALPNVVSFDAPDSPGWVPISVQVGPTPALPGARLGDTVQAGAFGGVITSASATVNLGS